MSPFYELEGREEESTSDIRRALTFEPLTRLGNRSHPPSVGLEVILAYSSEPGTNDRKL